MASLPESTYAVLGLADKRPGASGYELAALAEQSLAYFWPISKTLLYRELKRLEDLGWVRATPVRQSRAPDKRTYRLTRTGRRALTAWLDRAPSTRTQFRSGFLLKFFLCPDTPAATIYTLLDQYRQHLEAQRAHLMALVEDLEGAPRARMGRWAALHGVRTTEARLAWITEVEAEFA